MPSTTATTLPKFDVFLSFRGFDTRRNFISFLYKELLRKKIRTFKDDKELESGQKITPELVRAIQESKLAVVVISANYAASTWCLDELVHIMDFENNKLLTVMPIFYGVDPCHVRWQKGEVAEQFKKHEAREDHEKLLSWRQALTNLASISGNCSSECKDDSELVDKITEKISMTIAETRTSNGSNLAGINAHMKALSRLLDSMSKKEVRVIGIWARGGKCRSALAKHVYQEMSQDFESHCFLENVKRISQHRHLWHLRDEILLRIPEESLRHKNQRVLLVADDVSTLEQVDALAEDFNCFGPGSIVIITTQDKQLLRSYNIERVYEAEHLRFLSIFRQLAFKKKRDISAAFGRATNLAVELLGCLCVRSGYEKVLDSIY